jgi:hypothetical protein
MTVHALDVLFGVLGGIIPGGIHLAWNVTRNNKVTSGTVDFTLRNKQK